MWANAQRDGHPAEYRWRPLFNVAKFGWLPLLECCAVTLPRRETQTTGPISAASGPKFTILRGHVEEILMLNKFFFPIVDTCHSCEDITRQSCAMVSRWRLFSDFLGPAFLASCAARFRPAF